MNDSNPSAADPRFFSKEDVIELLVDEGFDENNCFIQNQSYNLIIELAHNFVEEVLDTFKHKKKQISVADIRKAISWKFPETYNGDKFQNKVISQNRATALDENDDRVREVQKKFTE